MGYQPKEPWLWMDREGHLSCGNIACTGHLPAARSAAWQVVPHGDLAELAAPAAAASTKVRCRCGALEYDTVSRMVRETQRGNHS